MVDVFHGVRFPVGKVTRRPQGQREVPADASALADLGPWSRTEKVRPISEPGAQVDVLFGSRDWGWALVGLYTNWSDEEVAKGAVRWQIYDQEKDRYVDYLRKGEPEPEYWMIKPRLPMPGDVADLTPQTPTERPLMAKDDTGTDTAPGGDTVADLRRSLAAARAEVEKLRDEVHELRTVPWPAWAESILKKLRSYGLDPDDEVHLADEFDSYMDEFEQEIRRQCARTSSPAKGSSFELNDEETEDLERAMAFVHEALDKKPRPGKGMPDPDGERAWTLRLARLRGRLAAFDERARKAKAPKPDAASAN